MTQPRPAHPDRPENPGQQGRPARATRRSVLADPPRLTLPTPTLVTLLQGTDRGTHASSLARPRRHRG